MAEHDHLSVYLGDGYSVIAAGVRRERNGKLTADLMLSNGKILYADRAILNLVDGIQAWATKATAPDRPTAAFLEEAILESLLPQALAIVQEVPKKSTQADQLVNLFLQEVGDLAADVAGTVELFHDQNGDSFATLPCSDHFETHRLRSRTFRERLARRFFEMHQKTPNAQALVDAINVLAGKALYDGPEHRVYTRIAQLDGVIYIDLCDELWRVVAIDKSGWRVIDESPVKFRRTRGMLPLPVPVKGGRIDDFRRFINVRSECDWCLIVAWLIGAMRAAGPYPVLIIHGEQGSAKSTLSRILRSLIDPNAAPIRTMARDERDLSIAAHNAWILCYDNISSIPIWLSDAFCRLSTGGGFATRMLYEDQDETIFDSQRPIIVNGIEEIATRNDLLDRAIIIYLPTIPDDRRRPEAALWAKFEAARPAIFGALLGAVSVALRREAEVHLDRLPRMADFATWVIAAEPALGLADGSFITAYTENRSAANDLTLETSLVSLAIQEFAAGLTETWEGTATELLKVLSTKVDEQTQKLKSWPESGRTLSNALRRLAPNLRAVGIGVTFDIRRHGGKRLIKIERLGNPSSPSSPQGDSPHVGVNKRGDDNVVQPTPSSPAPSPEDARIHGQGDDGVDGDVEIPHRSVERRCSLCGEPLPPNALSLCDRCEQEAAGGAS